MGHQGLPFHTSARMSRYALFGQSVARSPSPQVHAAFARQTGVTMEYVGIDVEPGALPAALEAFAASGGRGANVTVPHKQAAFAACAPERARPRGQHPVNTLRLDEGQWYGDNTDGAMAHSFKLRLSIHEAFIQRDKVQLRKNLKSFYQSSRKFTDHIADNKDK